MAKVKLTDAAVQRYKAAPGQRVNYFDATLPGFALRVSGASGKHPQGQKSWILFYRHGGLQKMLTFRPGYPALGLAAARKAAGEALQALGRGEDPAQLKAAAAAEQARQAQDTVASVVEEFLKRHMQGKARSARYIEATRRNFARDVLPRIGRRSIRQVSRRDIIELVDQIADRGAPIQANRVVASLSKLFNWALARGIVEQNPCLRLEKPGREKKRERVLSDVEIALVWRAAGQLPAPAGAFFRLALALGQRKGEVAGMRWDELELDEGLWQIAGARTKNGQPHLLPLSVLAQQVIGQCERRGRYVLAGRRRAGDADKPLNGFSKAKAQLDALIAALAAEAGTAPPAAWTIHDLRRTAATRMAQLGAGRFLVKRLLNHADGEVTGIYDRYEYLAEKRLVLDAWGRCIEALTSPAGGGNVVRFPAAVGG